MREEVSPDTAYDFGYADGKEGKPKYSSLKRTGLSGFVIKAYLDGYEDGAAYRAKTTEKIAKHGG